MRKHTLLPLKWTLGIGLLLLSGFLQATVRASGETFLLQQSIKAGKDFLHEARFSPDGRSLILLADDHKLSFWSASTGRRLRAFPTGEHQALTFVPHPSESILYSGGGDDTIRVWDTDRAEPLEALRGHLAPVQTLALDGSAKTLVSGGEDGAVIVWDLEVLKLVYSETRAHRGPVHSVHLHPREPILVSGGKDGKVRLWDLDGLQPIRTLVEHQKSITQVEFTPNGEHLISSSADGTLIVWDWKNGKVLQTLTQHTKSVNGFGISPLGREVLSGGKDGAIHRWVLGKEESAGALDSVSGPVEKVRFANNGKQILAALSDGTLLTWGLGTSSFLATLKGHERPVNSLDFTNNGRYLATASADKTIKLWDMEKHEVMRTYETESHRVQVLRFATDSKTFATGGGDSSIRFWNTQSGEETRNLRQHRGKVTALAFHPNGRVLLSGGTDKEWLLWNLESNEVIRREKAHGDQISSVAFSPDGAIFATAGRDNKVLLWSYPQGELLSELEGHRQGVTDVAFSLDGRELASASQDSTIRLWDVTLPGRPFAEGVLEGHGFIVTRVLFAQDGRGLVSVSRDKTVRLWDLKSGNLVRILNGERTPLSDGMLSPDGRLIAVANMLNEVSLVAYPDDALELMAQIEVEHGEEPGAGIAGAAEETSESGDELVADESMELQDLLETKAQSMSPEELQVYAPPPLKKVSNRAQQLQMQLNALLLQAKFCDTQDRLEKVAFQVLDHVPDDLSAYHVLVRTSSARGDFGLTLIAVRLSDRARYYPEQYQYSTEIEVRNTLAYWGHEVFDQSSQRRGRVLDLEVINCHDQTRPATLPEPLALANLPEEFVMKATSIPRLSDLRDFRGLTAAEFQNRLLREVERVSGTEDPHPSSRLPLGPEYTSEVVVVGKLRLDLTEASVWRRAGRVNFRVRLGSNLWHHYRTDRDSITEMVLPVGRYYLSVGNTLKRAFTLGEQEIHVVLR